MRSSGQLRNQLAITQGELAEVQAAIAQALADGTDARHHQARRDRLDAKVRDLGPAIRIAEEREAAETRKTDEAERERLRAVARQSQQRLFAAASAVDAAIEAAGAAYEAFRAELAVAKEAHRVAGSDMNAVERAMEHSLRWSMARGARRMMDDSGMPRVPTHREMPLLSSVKRTTPTV